MAVTLEGAMPNPKRILIVDDSSNVRRLVRANLESHSGFQICGEAADGLEAIDIAIGLKPDLIILDLCMPRMNGLEVAGTLKHLLRLTPIILFTLHEDILSENQTRAVGIKSVVSKMGEMNILFSEVQRLVDSARSASV
jgi:CheY-like chemotaxis protein